MVLLRSAVNAPAGPEPQDQFCYPLLLRRHGERSRIDLGVSFMFPNNCSITRPPPSLLPGSDGTRSPSFKRYYEAATTAGLVWRHSVGHVAPPYLRLISCVRSTSRGNRRCVAWVLLCRCHPLPAFRPEDVLGSPKFPGNPSVPLLCSQTPAEPPCLAILRHFGVVPPPDNGEDLSDLKSFEAQSHSFSTHCLRFVPSLLTTTQNSLPVVASLSGWDSNPLSSVGRFRPFGFLRP